MILLLALFFAPLALLAIVASYCALVAWVTLAFTFTALRLLLAVVLAVYRGRPQRP